MGLSSVPPVRLTPTSFDDQAQRRRCGGISALSDRYNPLLDPRHESVAMSCRHPRGKTQNGPDRSCGIRGKWDAAARADCSLS